MAIGHYVDIVGGGGSTPPAPTTNYQRGRKENQGLRARPRLRESRLSLTADSQIRPERAMNSHGAREVAGESVGTARRPPPEDGTPMPNQPLRATFRPDVCRMFTMMHAAASLVSRGRKE